MSDPMADDHDSQSLGADERLSRMSLDSLKERLEREQQAREAMRLEMAERLAEHDKKPKGVSPLWLASGIVLAVLVVVGLIYFFPPEAVKDWSLEFDSSPVEVDIPGPIPDPAPAVEAPAEEPQEEAASTSKRSTTMRRAPSSSSSSMSSTMAAPPANHANDPLYGL
jgi:hypothetical protein